MNFINLILGRKQVLVMSSPEWKQWVADMHKAFPDDVANKAIEITAKYQHFGWAR
jgi:hypothetical protein